MKEENIVEVLAWIVGVVCILAIGYAGKMVKI